MSQVNLNSPSSGLKSSWISHIFLVSTFWFTSIFTDKIHDSNPYLEIEFGGRNQAVLKTAPRKKKNQEEDKNEGGANLPPPKKVIVISVSLKEWLIK